MLVLGPPKFFFREFSACGKFFLDPIFYVDVFYIYDAVRFVIDRKNDPFFCMTFFILRLTIIEDVYNLLYTGIF